MPGTSTVPTIANGPTKTTVSISWVDDENQTFTDTFNADPAPADALLQTLVDTAQAGANPSSYKLEVTAVYEGQRSPTAAASAAKESVYDKIRLSFKDLSNDAYQQTYMPGPLTAIIGDGGVVDNENALYTAWRDAVIALIQDGFDPLNTEFVQNSKRNQKVGANA